MYKEVKDIANNLKILTWSDDPTECLSIKIDLYKGKFGNITMAFDFQANDYVLRQNITDENYCNIFTIGYDEAFAYSDYIRQMNFYKHEFTLEAIIKELKNCIDTMNTNTNYDLEKLDSDCYTFVNQVTNLMKE